MPKDKKFDTTPKDKHKVRAHTRQGGRVEVREYLRKDSPERFGDPMFSSLQFLSKPGHATAHSWTPEEIKQMKDDTWNKYVQENFEDHKTFEGSASRPQRIFHKTVQEWIKEQERIWIESEKQFAIDYPEEFEMPDADDIERNKYNMHMSMPYSFHARDQVTVDSTLYEILYYGSADYGFGGSLYEKLHKNLEVAGYGMENYGGGRHDFYKQ